MSFLFYFSEFLEKMNLKSKFWKMLRCCRIWKIFVNKLTIDIEVEDDSYAKQGLKSIRGGHQTRIFAVLTSGVAVNQYHRKKIWHLNSLPKIIWEISFEFSNERCKSRINTSQNRNWLKNMTARWNFSGVQEVILSNCLSRSGKKNLPMGVEVKGCKNIKFLPVIFWKCDLKLENFLLEANCQKWWACSSKNQEELSEPVG